MTDVESSDFGKYIEKLARDIWEKQALERGYDPVLVKAYGERLSEAVTKGYGKDIFQIDYNEPDYDKLKHLHIDAWKFATGKSQEHLDTLTKALRKPDGSMRSFDEFRIQTVIATGKQLRGLKAEYNTAIASAQMASKWEYIQQTKETYPYLEFVAVVDGHTTEKCRGLDGVIRPVDDPFWNKYYPPNHYNCRSNVKQLRKIPEGYQDPFAEPAIPAEFKTDFIMQGHLFPAEHKYYAKAEEDIALNYLKDMPEILQFNRIESEDKGVLLREHFLVEKKGDYDRVLNAVKAMKGAGIVKDGDILDIMPKVNRKSPLYELLYKDLIGTPFENKCPDIRINGKYFIEHEGWTTPNQKNAFQNMLNRGYKQSPFIIIDKVQLSRGDMIDKIIKRIKYDNHNIQEVWILDGNHLELLFKI